MEYIKLCDSDYRFMCVVWEHAPVNSGELVKLCQEQLGWKKSTTYTVVRKMCEKGYIANEDATVSVLIPKEQVQAEESRYFVDRTFDGSLPGFITAFLGGKKISKKEAKMLKKMIDEHKEGVTHDGEGRWHFFVVSAAKRNGGSCNSCSTCSAYSFAEMPQEIFVWIVVHSRGSHDI